VVSYTIGFSKDELLHTLNYLNIPLSKIDSPSLAVHYVIHGTAKAFIEQQLEFMLAKNNKEDCQKLFRVFLPVALYLLQNLEFHTYRIYQCQAVRVCLPATDREKIYRRKHLLYGRF